MHLIAKVLFENAGFCAVGLALVELFVLMFWARRRSRGSRRLVVVGAIAAIILPVVSAAVVTRDERVTVALQATARGVQRGDMTALSSALAEEFVAGGMSREPFLLKVERSLAAHRVEEVRVSQIGVRWMAPTLAVVEFTGGARLVQADSPLSRIHLRFFAEGELRGNAVVWRRLGLVPGPLSPVTDLRQLLDER